MENTFFNKTEKNVPTRALLPISIKASSTNTFTNLALESRERICVAHLPTRLSTHGLGDTHIYHTGYMYGERLVGMGDRCGSSY